MMLEIGNLLAAAKRKIFPNREIYLTVLHKLREKELKIKNHERSVKMQKKWLNELKAESTNKDEIKIIDNLLNMI